MFVNAGGEVLNDADSGIVFLGDTFYEGGNILRTNEQIVGAGSYQFIYQSARLGNFCYRFDNLSPGYYIVDLHFTEIINTNGPKGIRVFNVYVQEEKVLADFDIFAIVGSNKPLQLINSRGSVRTMEHDYIKCSRCAAPVEVSPTQKKLVHAKSIAKYETKIKELTAQCQLKTKECYEAWMSLTATNEQLEMVRMELDNVTFKTISQDKTVEKQAENLRNISSRYEHDKMHWAVAINNLQEKVKLMKREHSQLSSEAHECTDSIP
ncbi:Kinesin-like protein [Quillaja saponaria]|uniref:Kinesin-like protein n=1 Tax=Quillaja saponaria TaxID=32244 RepID=A0AAD7P6H3_QUISA|nr:Kinesin-like protein [Quillaja saponaria]